MAILNVFEGMLASQNCVAIVCIDIILIGGNDLVETIYCDPKKLFEVDFS
jgi:hypothetical protein